MPIEVNVGLVSDCMEWFRDSLSVGRASNAFRIHCRNPLRLFPRGMGTSKHREGRMGEVGATSRAESASGVKQGHVLKKAAESERTSPPAANV